MGSSRVTVGGAEIVIAPSDLLRIIENPSVFQHFHLLGLLGSLQELIIKLWEPLGAHYQALGASGSSFRAHWSLPDSFWELLGAHFSVFLKTAPTLVRYFEFLGG